MKNSIVVAVDKYLDPNLSEVKYAESDAQALAKAIQRHGFAAADQMLLLGDEATKTSIESAIRTKLKGLTAEDTLVLFYCGHSFANADGESFLTSFDTHSNDPEFTSLSLRWLFQQLQRAKCQRLMMFLDASSCGIAARGTWADDLCPFNDAELEQYFHAATDAVCFCACQAGEQSQVNIELKRRLWNHHVIEAWEGKHAAKSQHLLTAAVLQKSLSQAVPQALRKIDPQAVQTPLMYGKTTELILADLNDLPAGRAAEHPNAGQVKDSILLAERSMSVNRLSGFKKGYSIPNRHGSAAQSFINTLSAPDIETDIENVRARLKKEFKFKRLEVTVDNDGGGAANVTTPYFNYSVSVLQDPADPGQVVWRRAVDAITDPDKVLSSAFESVFIDAFDTIELTLHGGVDLEQLIDSIESQEGQDISVQYDDDEEITSCALTIKGHPLQVKVTKNTFAIVLPHAKGAKFLLKSLFDVQRALRSQLKVLTIPFA